MEIFFLLIAAALVIALGWYAKNTTAKLDAERLVASDALLKLRAANALGSERDTTIRTLNADITRIGEINARLTTDLGTAKNDNVRLLSQIAELEAFIGALPTAEAPPPVVAVAARTPRKARARKTAEVVSVQ